jgi:hypothetical protein|tara:strand:+ start:1118 stop:1288 length:171 start_codon:yes stop_codon:yes gene_type:complete
MTKDVSIKIKHPSEEGKMLIEEFEDGELKKSTTKERGTIVTKTVAQRRNEEGGTPL